MSAAPTPEKSSAGEALAPHEAPAPRTTAQVVIHQPSGLLFLQGREEFTIRSANVFGNRDFAPVCRALNAKIVFEAEVRYRFSGAADDDPMDFAEIFGFRIWGWSWKPDGTTDARLMFGDFEDFHGDYPPGEPYGWHVLLEEAVHQLREARASHRHNQTLPPRLVGGI